MNLTLEIMCNAPLPIIRIFFLQVTMILPFFVFIFFCSRILVISRVMAFKYQLARFLHIMMLSHSVFLKLGLSTQLKEGDS